MKKFAVTGLVAALLSGCGTLGNMFTQDQTLQQSAAFALNTTPDKRKNYNNKCAAMGIASTCA